ncbi:MAG TPA: hypothetical protein DCL63_06025, partial [Firmicutes bacterium]|nr:hypothetical protein [Bacillota bacterium]
DEAEKARRIKREMTRLRRLFKPMSKDRLQAAEGLIQEVAFMHVTLEETRYIIDRDGVIERFEQGKQKFLREHPATKVYSSLINRYAAACKQLLDLLPDGAPKEQEDELMAFVKRQRR